MFVVNSKFFLNLVRPLRSFLHVYTLCKDYVGILKPDVLNNEI